MLKRTAASRVVSSSSTTSAKKIKIEAPDVNTSQRQPQTNSSESQLKEEFIAMFSLPAHVHHGVSNSSLKEKFGDQYVQLAPIINEMTRQSRLTMSKLGEELCYNLVSEQMASKFTGLDMSTRLVYQVIERAGNKGVWTRDVRIQTNIQQQALNKIFKTLENRCLIKPVKSVTAKQKKLYMLYELSPSKDLTGGSWYTDMEFDHEFIHEIRTFILHCIKSINNGQGASIGEISSKVQQANISRVSLNQEEVDQLVQALVYDFLVERRGTNSDGDDLFVLVKRTTVMCDFKWWEVLSPDFHFRKMTFEDGITLHAHEHHYHSA